MNKNFLKTILFSFFVLFFFQNIFDQNILFAEGVSPNLNRNNENAITQVLCNVVNLLTGGIAKGVAMIAIVVVAIGLFMGKFSWGVGLATAIGIAMIFGASTVVDWLVEGIRVGDKVYREVGSLC